MSVCDYNVTPVCLPFFICSAFPHSLAHPVRPFSLPKSPCLLPSCLVRPFPAAHPLRLPPLSSLSYPFLPPRPARLRPSSLIRRSRPLTFPALSLSSLHQPLRHFNPTALALPASVLVSSVLPSIIKPYFLSSPSLPSSILN